MEEGTSGSTPPDDRQWATASQVLGTLGIVGGTTGGLISWPVSGTWDAAGAGAAAAALPTLLIAMLIIFRPSGRHWVAPSLAVATVLTAISAAVVAAPVAWSMRPPTPRPSAPDTTSPGPTEGMPPGVPLPTAPTTTATPTLPASTTPPPAESATPTPDRVAIGWPTDANDGSTSLNLYFGSEFFFPDWVSCEEKYCLAGEGDKIHVYRQRSPIGRVRSFDADVADPYATLIAQKFTPAQARALLKQN